jgi:ribosomal protein S18 acetylase RimI-like enzyme
LISVAAIHKNQVIGMGRVIGDRVIMCYILDLIVLPEFQGRGIGKAIMENLIAYVKDSALPTIGLFTAEKGLEKFYEKFGFFIRPSDDRGPCMLMHINKDGTIYIPPE